MPKQFGDDIQGAFQALVVLPGMGPTAIHQQLEKQFGAYAPSLNTIKAWYKEYRDINAGAPWRVEDLQPEDAARVLSIQAAVTLETQGRVSHFTVAVAEWVAHISAMAPDLSPMQVYMLAWFYAWYRQAERPSTALDAYLAFTPWRGGEYRAEYQRALANGWVPKPPAVFMIELNWESIMRSLAEAVSLLGKMSPEEAAKEAARRVEGKEPPDD